MLDNIELEDGASYPIEDIFVNEEVPEFRYINLSEDRDMGVLVTLIDLSGDETVCVLPHNIIIDLISELKTVDQNLRQMNTEPN